MNIIEPFHSSSPILRELPCPNSKKSMGNRQSNDVVLRQLTDGNAHFELVSSPVPSISTPSSPRSFLSNGSLQFFARIGPSLGGGSPAAPVKKPEHFSVRRVNGDGRCMFRALVKGMALNKGISLNAREERDGADELRMAVKEVICENGKDRHEHKEALIAITIEESLNRYCQRIQRPDFWGGESELLVLSKLCSQPIIVYIPEHEQRTAGWGSGFIPIAEYGAEFSKSWRNRKPGNVVRLLYSGSNHYDLLV